MMFTNKLLKKRTGGAGGGCPITRTPRFLRGSMIGCRRRQDPFHKLLLLLFTLLLQGCLQPVALPEIHKYQLCTPTTSVLRCTPCAEQTLYISLPQAMGPYNTTQMIYSQCPYEISSFAVH